MSKNVNRIFSDMSDHYDRVNKVCSSYTMVLWRKTAAREAGIEKPRYSVLDIGTGTGELAFEISKEASSKGKKADITGMDFSKGMLDVAKRKAESQNVDIKFEQGDALKLKYKSNSFDLVTSGFVAKNVDNQKRFASESYRVLKKGGKLVFIELIKPRGAINRMLINAYWSTVIRIGFIGSGDSFKSLKESVDRFDIEKFSIFLREAGFRQIRAKILFSGAAVLFTAKKA